MCPKTAGLIQEPHSHTHPDALADPFYSAAPSASAPDPPPAASATVSMSPHKRRASTEEPDMFPSRNYAPFNGTHRLQCCHCGTLDSRFSWRYWMKDKTFRLCSKCNGRFERRLRMTKKQPMDDEEDEGGEEGAEVDEEDADEERVVSKAAGRKGKGKARDHTGSRAPGSSSSSNNNNNNNINNNSSSSTSSGRGRGTIPAQRAGAGEGVSSSSARTPRGAAPSRTGSETAQRARPAAGTAAAAAAAQRTLRSDDAQDGDGRIGTGTDGRGGAAAAPAARASVEEGRDAAPPPSVPRNIASALSSSPDRLEEQTGGGADLPSDAELEDNPLLSITAPPSFYPPIASSRSGPAGGAPAGGAGAPAVGAPAGGAPAPAAAASRRAAPAAAASRAKWYAANGKSYCPRTTSSIDGSRLLSMEPRVEGTANGGDILKRVNETDPVKLLSYALPGIVAFIEERVISVHPAPATTTDSLQS
ncbi:hypothetical protein OC842_007757, partial [Tilletia horrida]